MIEVNRLFGATGFTFYNQNSTDAVRKILRSYESEIFIEVLNWTLPMKVDTWPPSSGVEVHYFAQVAALNDCLHRNRHVFQYGVFSDLDEIIVPRKHRSWSELISFLEPQPTHAYIFRNAFFFLDMPNDMKMSRDKTVKKFQITALLKTQREDMIYRAYERSKYIVQLDQADVVSVHGLEELRQGARTIVVPPELGLLQHYRIPMGPAPDRVVDRSMHRFKEDIIKRIERKHSYLDVHGRHI